MMKAAADIPHVRPPPLAGRHIVVTRPAAQARALAEGIAAAGGTPVLFPVLAIEDLEDAAPLLAVAERLEDFDLAIFVSANAVEKALSRIMARRPWPLEVEVAALGKATEQALARFGLHRVIAPRERFDSEALLALAALSEPAVSGKKVLIFRGDGGRELLAATLAARGARVEYVACYRRGKPDSDPAMLARLASQDRLDAIAITSSEGLRNLWEMVGAVDRDRLRRTLFVVPHERIAAQAHALGLRRVVLTAPGDEGLVNGLVAHFAAGGDHE